jgi:hypothetical protein
MGEFTRKQYVLVPTFSRGGFLYSGVTARRNQRRCCGAQPIAVQVLGERVPKPQRNHNTLYDVTLYKALRRAKYRYRMAKKL